MSAGSAKVVRTMCPMNCHPTLCGMLAHVREGRLVTLTGDEANPDSRGFLCVRGRAASEVIDNPERLLFPLMRDARGAPLRRATWDEALERIAQGMPHDRPQSVAIWPGHGVLTTNYGTRIAGQLLMRLANFYGCQYWNPTMLCWGLGAFGLAVTGLLDTQTNEDLNQHSQLVLMWGANLASQPNTARHVLAARQRGARLIAIDVRHSEAAAKADDVYLIKPGGDTSLALAMMHVICREKRYDAVFVARHTLGFDALQAHLAPYDPDWASRRCGLSAERIVTLARHYADIRPAMIVLGGSSMHKGENGWAAARAISCLPALTGNVGVAGSGFGPRHGSSATGRGLANISAPERRTVVQTVANQMAAINSALVSGQIETLLLMGTNMMSSFANAGEVGCGLQKTRLVVSYDLFLNDTARDYADVVLPATAWLEELGCKMTHTHLYLMEPALEPPGEVRSLYQVVCDLARRLGLTDFNPWPDEQAMIDAILAHPATGHASVASLRAQGGIGALDISPVAYPTLQFDTPSGKLEFHSSTCEQFGLPPLPCLPEPYDAPASPQFPLTLASGRTLTHFHSFYNNGQVLPTLAAREREPHLWISHADATPRRITDGQAIRLINQRGTLLARARVTDKISAGTVWMRDGWPGLNRLTSDVPVLPDRAVDHFGFSAGQSSYAAQIEVEPLSS